MKLPHDFWEWPRPSLSAKDRLTLRGCATCTNDVDLAREMGKLSANGRQTITRQVRYFASQRSKAPA